MKTDIRLVIADVDGTLVTQEKVLIAETTWPSKLAPTCYVCGPTSFVEVAAGLLTACGNSPNKIRTERFGPTGDRK